MIRVDSDFFSEGTRCAGRLYLPEGVHKPPVVIMAHGFAAQCDFGLPAFAERFTGQGLAVYMFDYRNFGASGGEPRNLVNPGRQVQDWKAALAHVRRLAGLNTEKIALWGTSFSGGHVLAVAAKTPGISAVVAQVPFVDGLAVARKAGLKYVLQGFWHGLRDLLRAATFRRPYCVPVVADPDTFAVMNTPESKPGYLSLLPAEGAGWENRCPARILWRIPFYRPGAAAARINCPVLIVAAENDSLIPVEAVERTARKIKKVKYVSLPVGHFDVYTGDVFDYVSRLQGDFLRQHLA